MKIVAIISVVVLLVMFGIVYIIKRNRESENEEVYYDNPQGLSNLYGNQQAFNQQSQMQYQNQVRSQTTTNQQIQTAPPRIRITHSK